jgi:aminopeptidase
MSENTHIHRLAELIVKFGANLQPGQILTISSEPGKEPLARAVADVAYRHGA